VEIKNTRQARTPVIELGPLKPEGSLEISYSDSCKVHESHYVLKITILKYNRTELRFH
jgi:hypothetical protein